MKVLSITNVHLLFKVKHLTLQKNTTLFTSSASWAMKYLNIYIINTVNTSSYMYIICKRKGLLNGPPFFIFLHAQFFEFLYSNEDDYI